MIIILVLLGILYIFLGITSYFYWQAFFHEHRVCRTTYGTCSEGCGFLAGLCSIIWPVWPFIFIFCKYTFVFPKSLYSNAKKLGRYLARMGS